MLEPSRFSLQTLNEIEGRLAVCARLRAKLRQSYDYRTTPLAFLQDLEFRWDACERIQKKYHIHLRHDYYTAPALAALEKRLDVASRIYQTYGRDVSWGDMSLQQLETTEKQLVMAQTPLPRPHVQPLASNAVVFRSSTPTPRVAASTRDTESYVYQPAVPVCYASPTYTPAKTSRCVTSAPVFYNTYHHTYIHGGWSGYCPPRTGCRVPAIPCIPSIPSVPAIRLW